MNFKKLVLNKKSKSSTTWSSSQENDSKENPKKSERKFSRSSESGNKSEEKSTRSFSANQSNIGKRPTSVSSDAEDSSVVLLRSAELGESLEVKKDDRSNAAFVSSVVVEEQDLSDKEEGTMMEARKHFLAPPNPPPPVPTQVKNGTPLKVLNGSVASVGGVSTLPSQLGTRSEMPSKVDGSNTTVSSGAFSSKTHDKSVSGSSGTVRTLQLNGHVGFDSLPHQLVRKCTEQGFQFNMMCVGETGMGKTTLIESLFNMKLEFPPCNNELKTVELLSKTYDVVEGGIRLKLTIIETAGFGDQLDKDKSAQVIVEYINEQFEKYLKEELKIKRCLDYYDDTRIHACLYFISPTGHGLKALDVVTMRRLSERVNVIPVIAKADTTCKDELTRFKSKILSELRSHNIPIYQFPTDDETVRAINTELNQLLPYAVVGSTEFVKKENGKLVRARKYPWGIVEVENEEHCDFVKLREAVLRTNVDALRERTHKVLYETYRRERLRAMKVGDGDTGPKMMEAFAQKQREFNDEMANKEKLMREEFIARVSKKEEEMKRREELLNMKTKEVTENFETEVKRLESQMNTLLEERQKLEAKAGKKARK